MRNVVMLTAALLSCGVAAADPYPRADLWRTKGAALGCLKDQPVEDASVENKAAWALRVVLCARGSDIAGPLLLKLHPNATGVQLASYEVGLMGSDTLLVTLRMTWFGGVVGMRHETIVEWRFQNGDASTHSTTRVLKDFPARVNAGRLLDLNKELDSAAQFVIRDVAASKNTR